MDFSKIFLKDACPTKIGGQAVIEGIMMKGLDRAAVCVRLPDGRMHIKTEGLGASGSKWMKVPLIRGVIAFVSSLVSGTKTLLYAADVLEDFERNDSGASADSSAEAGGSEEPSRFEKWFSDKFGERALWSLMLAGSVLFAIALTVGVFIILPTYLVNFLSRFTENEIVLNLVEGVFRIIMFVIYVAAISQMNDIRRVFQYHGAEHKTIHCFENGLELTPENAQQFYTLHPRCGTSFLMFVMIISLVLFSLLGWPDLKMRIISRLLLVPVVAGISYELLRWAGRSDNVIVRLLSLPGLYLQKLTTRTPDNSQLEVAIAAMRAVTVPPETPYYEGRCGLDGRLLPGGEYHVASEPEKEQGDGGASK